MRFLVLVNHGKSKSSDTQDALVTDFESQGEEILRDIAL